jgi:hypothetical protein
LTEEKEGKEGGWREWKWLRGKLRSNKRFSRLGNDIPELGEKERNRMTGLCANKQSFDGITEPLKYMM